MVDELPSGDNGEIVPVVLPPIGVGIVPSAVAGISAADVIIVVGDVVAVAVLPVADVEKVPGSVDCIGTGATVMDGGGGGGIAGCGAGTVEPGSVEANDVAGCADSISSGAIALSVVVVEEAAGTAGVTGGADITGAVAVVLPIAGIGMTGTTDVPATICPVGTEQVTTVPGVAGSEASGTGASVVSGAPGWVAAENGLGPSSGDVTIAPGVDARPMAVVPMVDTCARHALSPASRMAAANTRRRIAPPSAPI